MQLSTTYRGLNNPQANAATEALKRSSNRLDRLLTGHTIVKAVVEGGPECRVILKTHDHGVDFSSQSNGQDLPVTISTALDKLRAQIIRHRGSHKTRRQRG